MWFFLGEMVVVIDEAAKGLVDSFQNLLLQNKKIDYKTPNLLLRRRLRLIYEEWGDFVFTIVRAAGNVKIKEEEKTI